MHSENMFKLLSLFTVGLSAKCMCFCNNFLVLFFVFLVTPCPSSTCWNWNSKTGKCKLRTDIDTNLCFSITCFHDKMSVKFSPDLYGVEIEQNSAFGDVDDPCLPKWNGKEYEWTHPLGNCDMKISNKQIDNSK